MENNLIFNSENRFVKLNLPEKFDLVVGDNFELFYKGIISAIDPYRFDYEISFDGKNFGHSFKRKYVWTPELCDVGQHRMSLTVRGDNGVVVDSGSVILNVVDKPKSPNSQKVVLCVGDSLTRNGIWPAEFGRRLTATGGMPEGYGLDNIRFIGESNKDGYHYTGVGGWNFISYNTENKNGKTHCVYGDFDKTDADQHSIYSDSDGNHWKLETIENNKIKIDRILTVTKDFSPHGTLIHVGGGMNHSPIVYSFEEPAASNPFWYQDTQKVDFLRYAKEKGVNHIDYCYVLLGWNSTRVPEEDYKAQTRTFLDNLFVAFPNCKVSLMGIQVPSRDGIGQNYGVSWKYTEKLSFVWELQRWYTEISKEPAYFGKVEYVNVSGQFDTDYNMISGEFAANNRNQTIERRQINGVHPASEGYLQIADVALRNFVSKLSYDEKN